MLPLQWFYTLINAHLYVFKLQAFTMYESHSIVTSAILAVCYYARYYSILHAMIYGDINVCQSCELVTH